MADRIIRVREQQRLIMRGLTHWERGARIVMDDDEILDITIDWSGWLGSDTIASVTNIANSASIVSQSNTTTTATLFVRGTSGVIEHRITTAGGRTCELPIYVNGSLGHAVYGFG